MTSQPSAELVFDTLYAFQRSAALKAAIALDVFIAVGDGADIVVSPPIPARFALAMLAATPGGDAYTFA